VLSVSSRAAAPAVKLSPAGVAGAVFALGCVQRANVVTRGRLCVENVHDVIIFEAARETKQPVRTWALHAWWLLLDASGSSFQRYVQPTLSLLDAHILSTMHVSTYNPSVVFGDGDSSLATTVRHSVQCLVVCIAAVVASCVSLARPRCYWCV
jgi:hypothetical protein